MNGMLGADRDDFPEFEEEPDDIDYDAHFDEEDAAELPQGAPGLNEDAIHVLADPSALAPLPPSVMNGFENVPKSNVPSLSSFSSKTKFSSGSGSGVLGRRQPMNPKDLALLMQADRIACVGDETGAQLSTTAAEGAAATGADSSTTTATSAAVAKHFSAAELLSLQLEAVSTLVTKQPAIVQLHPAEMNQWTHKRPPADLDADFCTCVLSNGDRVFLFKHNNNNNNSISNSNQKKQHHQQQHIYNSSFSTAGLLGKPFSALMKEVDALRVKKLLDQNETTTVATSSSSASSATTNSYSNGNSSSGDLWVDKYSPKSFTQLLSPEKINREVLKALKKWDKFVFKSTTAETATTAATTTAAMKRSSDIGGSSFTSAEDSKQQQQWQDDPRPYHKVILLCGPPGTGKTTLAHIVAKHCGYRALEINASDDRSPEVLRDRIARATLNSTLDSDRRPNCIILDEIDGIDGSRNALDCLTAIIKAPLTAVHHNHNNNSNSNSSISSGSSNSGKGGGSGKASTNNNISNSNSSSKKSGVFALTRPMICICNDQFAPALRELRRLADVFVFTAPKELRLVQRLRQVCACEGLQVSNSSAITELCSATGFDIRSSINNLQFAALKSLQEMKEQKQQLQTTAATATVAATTAVEKQNKAVDIGNILQKMIRNGMKDDNLDLFQVWKQIFTSQGVAQQYSEVQQRLQDNDIAMRQNSTATATDSTTAAATSTAGSATAATAGSATAATTASLATARIRIDNSCMRALEVMKNFGDSQQVISGIWENVHKLDSQRPNFNRNAIAAEAISIADMLQSFSFAASDGFQVAPYVPVVAAQIRCFCASSRSNVRIEWPHKDRDVFYKSQQKRNILRSLQDAAPITNTLMHSPQQQLVLDVISPLLDILHPRVRALPMLTLSGAEQAAVTAVVTAMEAAGICYAPRREVTDLRYNNNSNSNKFNSNKFGALSQQLFPQQQQQQQRFMKDGSSGSTVLQLDPAIDQLVQYDDHVPEELAQRHTQVPHDLRQLLRTEQKKYSTQLKIALSAAADAAAAATKEGKSASKKRPFASAAAVSAFVNTLPAADATTAATASMIEATAKAAVAVGGTAEASNAVVAAATAATTTAAATSEAAAAGDVKSKKRQRTGGLHSFFKRVDN